MSTPKVLNGRKPISAKPKATAMNTLTEDIFGNALALPPELTKELEDQGLVGRFVSSKILYSNQGYHPKGWKPYKRKSSGSIDGMEFRAGADPEGLVRRGDCILATKTVEEHKKHKDYLEAKAERYKGHNKQKARELREYASSAGVKTHVDEGFDGDEDDND